MNAPADAKLLWPLAHDVVEVSPEVAPILSDTQPRYAWRIVVFGGVSPRTGFALEPMEFNYFHGFTRKQVLEIAREQAEWTKRTHVALMPPLTAEQMDARRASYGAMIDKGQRAFGRAGL
jgi:hypothetical protein